MEKWKLPYIKNLKLNQVMKSFRNNSASFWHNRAQHIFWKERGKMAFVPISTCCACCIIYIMCIVLIDLYSNILSKVCRRIRIFGWNGSMRAHTYLVVVAVLLFIFTTQKLDTYFVCTQASSAVFFVVSVRILCFIDTVHGSDRLITFIVKWISVKRRKRTVLTLIVHFFLNSYTSTFHQ